MINQTILHYRITGQLGSGGVGAADPVATGYSDRRIVLAPEIQATAIRVTGKNKERQTPFFPKSAAFLPDRARVSEFLRSETPLCPCSLTAMKVARLF